MYAERDLAETAELQLSPALLAAVKHGKRPQPEDFRVEGWTPSLFGRVVDLFAPKRKR
jgi:hypothetical protein